MPQPVAFECKSFFQGNYGGGAVTDPTFPTSSPTIHQPPTPDDEDIIP